MLIGLTLFAILQEVVFMSAFSPEANCDYYTFHLSLIKSELSTSHSWASLWPISTFLVFPRNLRTESAFLTAGKCTHWPSFPDRNVEQPCCFPDGL
jgi:hypothetical protein